MRRRAYRPEAPSCLEERSLLSGVAGPSTGPVVLVARRYDTVIDAERLDFQLFTRNHDIGQLGNFLEQGAKLIPFGQQDGLGVKIRSILRNMQQEIHDRVRFAIPHAAKDVIFATRAEVAARIQTGDVILVDER